MPAAVAIPLVTAAIGAGTTVYGARSAGKSARRASNVQATSDAAALEDARAQREEAKRQFDAQQAQQAKEFAASEEQRVFDRQQAEFARQNTEYQQQLLREREQRAAPYRQLSQQAVGRLGDLLGLSRGMPMASPAPMQGGSAPMPAPMNDPRFQNVSRGMSMADLLNLRGAA